VIITREVKTNYPKKDKSGFLWGTRQGKEEKDR
jgi:hypothetical protein